MDDHLYDALADAFAPQVLALFAEEGIEKDRILRLGELCQKHGVSFGKVVSIFKELNEWEAKYDNHRKRRRIRI